MSAVFSYANDFAEGPDRVKILLKIVAAAAQIMQIGSTDAALPPNNVWHHFQSDKIRLLRIAVDS